MVIVKDTSAARRKVRGVRRRIENPEVVWPRVGRVIQKAVRKQFSSAGAYLGTPWRPLKPNYRVWKVANGYPRTILVMTGEMRGSFTSNPMNVQEMHGQTATFGSKNQKAIWHHGGTSRNGRQINPARPILWAHPLIRKDVKDVIEKYIVGRNTFGVEDV